MKNEITKLETIPLSVNDMWEAVQELWSEVNPKEWRYLTKRLTCKLEDVIESKGMATIYVLTLKFNYYKCGRLVYSCFWWGALFMVG
jgi:hypothetical protein